MRVRVRVQVEDEEVQRVMKQKQHARANSTMSTLSTVDAAYDEAKLSYLDVEDSHANNTLNTGQWQGGKRFDFSPALLAPDAAVPKEVKVGAAAALVPIVKLQGSGTVSISFSGSLSPSVSLSLSLLSFI